MLLECDGVLRSDATALAALLDSREARVMLLAGQGLAIVSNAERTAASIRWFRRAEAAPFVATWENTVYLGRTREEGHARFAVAVAGTETETAAAALKPIVDLRSLAAQGAMSEAELSLAGLAKALQDWHAGHRFCGRCGSRAFAVEGGWKRACTACGLASFPRVDPVVIMLVTDGEACVLARQPQFPPGMYSLPAGFIEPGEDIEAAVIRETLEETGLTASDVRYELSQPWPFPHSLMIGCVARISGGALRPDTVELEDVRLVPRAETAAMLSGTHPECLWIPGRHAIAHALIRRWLDAAP